MQPRAPTTERQDGRRNIFPKLPLIYVRSRHSQRNKQNADFSLPQGREQELRLSPSRGQRRPWHVTSRARPISLCRGGNAESEGQEDRLRPPLLASLDAVAPQPPTAGSEGLARLGRCGGRRTGKDGAEPRLPPSLSPSSARPPPPSLPSLPRPRLRPRPVRCSVFCRENVGLVAPQRPGPLAVAGLWLPPPRARRRSER